MTKLDPPSLCVQRAVQTDSYAFTVNAVLHFVPHDRFVENIQFTKRLQAGPAIMIVITTSYNVLEKYRRIYISGT